MPYREMVDAHAWCTIVKNGAQLAPEGTWLANRAVVSGRVMDRAWLTITTEHATLRVNCAQLPSLVPVDGYWCVVEAAGWRWTFRGIAEHWTAPAPYGRGRIITVAIQSTTDVVAERL